MLLLLARCDGLATGPQAWTGWKESLVFELADKVRAAITQGRLFDARDAAIMEVSAQGVVVRFGDKMGLISANELNWAKGRVEAGDLIWASILATPDKNAPADEPASGKTSPEATAKPGRKGKAQEPAPVAPSRSTHECRPG